METYQKFIHVFFTFLTVGPDQNHAQIFWRFLMFIASMETLIKW